MKLFHITTSGCGSKHYAARAGSLGTEPIITWVGRKGAATMFPKTIAMRLARRMRRLRMRTKIEAA
jgi:hypothetical protein